MNPLFGSRLLPRDYDVLAPDGSEVRLLAAGARGSMAPDTTRTGSAMRRLLPIIFLLSLLLSSVFSFGFLCPVGVAPAPPI